MTSHVFRGGFAIAAYWPLITRPFWRYALEAANARDGPVRLLIDPVPLDVHARVRSNGADHVISRARTQNVTEAPSRPLLEPFHACFPVQGVEFKAALEETWN